MIREYSKLVTASARTVLGLVAVLLVTVSAFGFVGLLALDLTGVPLSPYLGILTYMVLPAGFIAGLVLLAIAASRERRAARAGDTLSRWHLDFDDPAHRRRLALVGGLTVANLMLLGLASYHGVHFMDSTTFCGEVCHKVMEPEHTAYEGSAHARVACTDCHIGPGASWFVKSKMSGSRQVLAVMFHTYPTPIPTPIHNLRPARETCEQCHWPAKFVGDRIKVLPRFKDDEQNTELQTVLLLKVGGGSGLQAGSSQGIHWHTSSRVDYRSDPDRKQIYWVRVDDGKGNVREYWRGDMAAKQDSIRTLEPRRMDCIDCHNRPTHQYQLPSDALDTALQTGAIATDLPYVKREGMRLLQMEWPSKQAALVAFPESLLAFYTRNYPEVAAARAVAIAAAAERLRETYARNVFPQMKVGWGTYPNHLGHGDDGGCFRCHDEQHATADGKTISQDCSTCHNLLAYEEKDPAVLQVLSNSK